MKPSEFAIYLVCLAVVAFALTWWAWSMTSATYPRNVTPPTHPTSNLMPYR